MSDNYIEGLFDGEECGLQHLKVDIECAYLEKGEAIVPEIEKEAELFKEIAEVSVLELYKIDKEYGAFAELLYRLITFDEGDLKASVNTSAIQAMVKAKAIPSTSRENEDPTNPNLKGGMTNGIRRRFGAAAAAAQAALPAGIRPPPVVPQIRAAAGNLKDYIEGQLNAAARALRAAPPPALINRLLAASERISVVVNHYATPERREILRTFLTTTAQLLKATSHYAWINSGLVFNDSMREEQLLQQISFRLLESNENEQYTHTQFFYQTMKAQAEANAELPGADRAQIARGIARIDALMQERTSLHEQLLRNQQNPRSIRVILRSIIIATRRIIFWSILIFIGPTLIITILEYSVQGIIIPGVDLVFRDLVAYLLGQVHETASEAWKGLYSGVRSTIVGILYGIEGYPSRPSGIPGLPNIPAIPGIPGILTAQIPGVRSSAQDLYKRAKENAIASMIKLILLIPAVTFVKGVAAVWGISFFISVIYYFFIRNSIEVARADLLEEFDRRTRPGVVARAAAINQQARQREEASRGQPFFTVFGNIFYGGKTRRRRNGKKRKHTRKH